jgi:bifunctional polynucleotide phosphatase/kinase
MRKVDSVIICGDVEDTDPAPIYAFDLDWTLIRPSSGKFCKSTDDYKWLYDNVIDRLKQLNQSSIIVLFTNQKQISQGPHALGIFEERIANISKDLGFKIRVFASSADDRYRKPFPSMWEMFVSDFAPWWQWTNLPTVYIGDAAGRENDFSDSDRNFAHNISSIYSRRVDFKTPEEFFLGHPAENFALRGFDASLIPPYVIPNEVIQNHPNEMIILCGIPGVGKTSFRKKYFPEYLCVNYDSGNRKILNCDKSIIIDNTNMSVRSRKEFLDFAKSKSILCRCILFDFDAKLAAHLAKCREYLRPAYVYKHITDVCYRMMIKSYQRPTLDEGFTRIDVVQFSYNPDIMDKKILNMRF